MFVLELVGSSAACKRYYDDGKAAVQLVLIDWLTGTAAWRKCQHE